jgi:hypothetical protein
MNSDKTITANFSISSGTYDDIDANITYSVGWTSVNPLSGPYNSTIHRSTTVGDTATLMFSGIRVKLIYTRADTSGVIQIVIDGGTAVNLDAYSAIPQWQAEWTSDLLTNGPHTITVTHSSGTNMDVDAFTIVGHVCRTLTLAYSGTGSAPTASPTNSTGCSSRQYFAEETITLTSNPGTCYHLDNWAGTNGSSSNILTMPDSNTTVTANYALIPSYTLTRNVDPPNSGTIGVSPNSNCTGGKYSEGISVQLTATPATGWTFDSWTGGLTGGVNPGSVIIHGDTSVTANFIISP